MNQDVPKCPYNSVYLMMESRNKEKKKSTVCCEHGRPCGYAEKSQRKEETAPYVNLMKEGGQDRNACEVSNKNFDKLQELAAKLREVEMNSTERKAEKKEKKKADKKKKKPEMVKMEKILNDDAELTFDEEARFKMDSDANESDMKALSKAMFSFEGSTDTSEAKKKNKKKAPKESSERSVTTSASAKSENRRQKKQKKQKEDNSGPIKAKYVEEVDITRSMYLGAVTKSAAEKNLNNRADFRIYHQVEKYNNLDDLPAAIKLFMVCKTDEGFRHDPIKQAFSPTGNTKLYVEKGEEAMMFRNLDELVSYYEVQSRLQPEEFLL